MLGAYTARRFAPHSQHIFRLEFVDQCIEHDLTDGEALVCDGQPVTLAIRTGPRPASSQRRTLDVLPYLGRDGRPTGAYPGIEIGDPAWYREGLGQTMTRGILQPDSLNPQPHPPQ